MEFTYILYMGEAIALTVMLGVIAIPLARKYKAQQSIREEGPKSHRLKAGTPTMGGLFVCLSVVLYYIFAVLVVVGASNAVNLTDGLDGLASGCSVVTFLAYSVYCYVNGIHDIGLFSAILAGGCVGFLFFNYHPAEIFMGDTGSLALGGAVAGQKPNCFSFF